MCNVCVKHNRRPAAFICGSYFMFDFHSSSSTVNVSCFSFCSVCCVPAPGKSRWCFRFVVNKICIYLRFHRLHAARRVERGACRTTTIEPEAKVVRIIIA